MKTCICRRQTSDFPGARKQYLSSFLLDFVSLSLSTPPLFEEYVILAFVGLLLLLTLQTDIEKVETENRFFNTIPNKLV